MDLPKSGAKGFFEILMPGVFLLLNLLATLGLLAWGFGAAEQQAAQELLMNPSYALALMLSFGYLLGVVLRLFRTQLIDKWSGSFNTFFRPDWSRRHGVGEPFFYGSWMKDNCHRRCGSTLGEFYDKYWAPRYNEDDPYENTSFFNLCKSIIARIDPDSASDVNSAEAMLRFIAGCAYALVCAFVLALVDVAILLVLNPSLAVLPAVVAFVYLLVLFFGILPHFRMLRRKEVGTLVFASFANRDRFATYFESESDEVALSEFSEREGADGQIADPVPQI